jgi:murein DD-endopeptidase MepM/ murein hydrolase activator NlpD
VNDPDYTTYGYDSGYSTASYQTVGAVYADDPLFGAMPQAPGSYPDNGYGQNWDSGAYQAYPEYQQYPQYEHPQQYPEQYFQPVPGIPVQYEPEPHPEPEPAHAYEPPEAQLDPAPEPDPEPRSDPEPQSAPEPQWALEPEPEPELDDPEPEILLPPSAALPGPRSANRNRRRRPAKRSALLTVAFPSVAVMGVAACAAATVTSNSTGSGSGTTTTQADAATSTVTTKLDQQLAGVSRDANDFADRASRTQERIDLKERQTAEKKKKEEEAAAKEAARPKYLLPVTQKGLSAYFGQAGVNWMSVHTGIDFPVSYGTPVMAATDGTVRTQWNSSYGNMAIVTSPDGTETWYCHLSSTKIRSGSVKAGDVIAYSGNSGNSTGPHLHFEVRPNGGAAIDPLQWLLNKGLDPR